MKPPSVLLFDLGGVLVENRTFECLKALTREEMPDDHFMTRWLRSDAVRSFEQGTCTASSFAARFIEEWDLPLTAHQFLESFASWPEGLYPGAADLLAALRRRFVVGCLSNSNAVHWERFGGFREHFDIALSSHLLGHVKPDADAFAAALDRCNAPPFDVAFFDDSPVNVSAAGAIGLRAFHCRGLDGVRHTLAAQGWM